MLKSVTGHLKSIFSIFYYFSKDVFDFQGRFLLKKNARLKNIYKGKRAFLVCSGSSINYFDLSLLSNEQTMCIGHMYSNKSISELNPKMFLLGETYKGLLNNDHFSKLYNRSKFSEYKDQEYNEKYQEFLTQVKSRDYWYCKQIDKNFNKNSLIFVKSEDYSFVKNKGLYLNKDVVYTKYKGLNFGQYKLKQNNLTKRNYAFNIGSFGCALTTLMYMGFNEIYLLGAGYTMKPNLQLHFYDNYIIPENLGLEQAYKIGHSIAKLHSESYKKKIKLFNLYKKNKHYHCQLVSEYDDKSSLSKAHYNINNMAIKNNIKIFNVVPDGFESPVFKKISQNEVKKFLNN